MATLLIRNIPEDLYKELKRQKVERGCKTWADFLTDLLARRGILMAGKEENTY